MVSMIDRLRPFRLAALGAVFAFATTACGGFGPGDYRVYRIAFQQTDPSPDCFGTGMVPIDVQDDSTNQFQSGTFTVFIGADDAAYLDTGTIVLRGVEQGDGYVFDGTRTDVNTDGNDPATETTNTVTTNVIFNLEDLVVEGTYTETTSFSCTGPACPDPASNTCTLTTPFVGGEVEDVDIEHEV